MKVFSKAIILTWLLMFLVHSNDALSALEDYHTYIINMGHSHKPTSFSTHESWYMSILASLPSFNTTSNQETLLYSYNHVMQGFSARLTPSQLSEIEKLPAHLATYRESFGKLFTTYTPKFLGLTPTSGIWPAASYGKDVIIGIIDTGVWPESKSFSDEGMSPVPKRWKGACENGTAFNPSLCNRKLIGARSFSKGLQAAGIKISEDFDYNSARDSAGHGTHTLSTAAGSPVLGASYFGYAAGTATGVAPGAHAAMYKVLWATDSDQSAATDVLAGMDQAIADGVDIMSLSLGFDHSPLFDDIIAIASLSATEKGIFVVCSAGNDGPDPKSTYNGAPWITTVGAGTVDRNFVATMTLGNGMAIAGTSYFPQSVYITDAQLYYGKEDTSKAGCDTLTLDSKEVAGKLVLCDNSSKVPIQTQMEEVKRSGAYGGIFMSDALTFDPSDCVIPTVVLQTGAGALVRKYVVEVRNATVKEMRFVITKIGAKLAPQVTSFSSRGPDPVNPGVLKPDIIAPGEDVLAAFPPNIPYTEVGVYRMVTDYALLSGTSMAAPHVAGVAALLKAIHHDWSPAAIRSAIMTTAYTIDNTQKTITEEMTGLPTTPLDFGAGHINPNKISDPGLVYDMGFQDYVDFLCSLGYNEQRMSATIRRTQWSCHDNTSDLNYPSFVAIFPKEARSTNVKNFSRVVTNVGVETAVYHAVLEFPSEMKAQVEPATLQFTGTGQKQRFVLSVEVSKDAPNITYGYLKWVDQNNHIVSSPVVSMLG